MTPSVVKQISLEGLGFLKISGLQSTEFLQGQLSCDVTEVTSTQSRLGAHCNAQGRMLTTFRLFYRTPHYYLILPQIMVHWLLKDLSKYAPFYKVNLQDASAMFEKKGLAHPNLSEDLRSFPEFKLEQNEVYTNQTTTLLSIPGIIPRVMILSTACNTREDHTSLKPFSYWEALDIKSGIATLMPETRGLFTPHHLHYPQQGGVSFTKGCYTGQEVIARMHYLGKLKQQLCKFTFCSQHSFPPGTDLVDQAGKIQGTLVNTSSNDHEPSTYQALAVIHNTAMTEPLYLQDIPLESLESTMGFTL